MKYGEKPLYKKILVAFLCILAAIYLLYHLIHGMRKNAEFYIVRPYTADDTQTFTGYIFREETVLTSYMGGMCNYHYYDGEKVAAGSNVADIYRYGSESIAAKIADVKKQIEILRKSTTLGKLTVEDVQIKIDYLSYEIAEKNAAGDTAAASALSDELLVLMTKKDLLISGKTDYDEEIALLESQKASLANALGYPTESVYTERSGYFYSETDGYEELFTADVAKDISFETFDLVASAAPNVRSNAVGTLVTSSEWYYVVKARENDGEGFLVGAIYDCVFIDNSYTEPIPMKLISKNTEEGETLLVFFSSSLPRDFDITRIQRMEAVRMSYDGYRIPSEVVRAKDGVTFVYVFEEGIAKAREVEILWEQNGYYIVSADYKSPAGNQTLDLNDMIIIEDPDLYEGKFID